MQQSEALRISDFTEQPLVLSRRLEPLEQLSELLRSSSHFYSFKKRGCLGV